MVRHRVTLVVRRHVDSSQSISGRTTAMTTYWCANFDGGDVLDHGLEIDAWLLQYQYKNGGFEYQGNPRQKGRTTAVWKSLTEISVGDWLLAYLPGNAFFAVGKVRRPRKFPKNAVHKDSAKRTFTEKQHLYLDGIVQYTDAEALYEDFTDSWSHSLTRRHKGQPRTWLYPQRVDVDEWKYVVPDGITMTGLACAAPFPEYRKPIFQIDAEFFTEASKELRSESLRLK